MTRIRISAAALGFATASALIPVTPAAAQSADVFRVMLGVGANESEQTLTWRSPSPAPEQVRFYPTDAPANAVIVDGKAEEHGITTYFSKEAVLTGLEPNTEYAYQIGTEAAGWSQPQSFRTGDGDDTWDFLAFGDAQIGVGGVAFDREQADNWNAAVTAGLADAPNAEMLLSLGDQVDGWGGVAFVTKQYDHFFEPDALRSIPTAVLPGNHETYPTYLEGMAHFREHSALPNEHGDSNYFYERNNALFVSLNTNLSSPEEIADQANFVRSTVAEHGQDKDWVIVTEHHSPFSQGTHYTDDDVRAIREQLTPVFSEVGVDLVLSGHDHIYTRSHLMNGTQPVIPSTAAKRGDVLTPGANETLYIATSTTGAGKFYDFQAEDGRKLPNARQEFLKPEDMHPSTAVWRQDYTPDYSKVAVTPTELTVTTYNVHNPQVVDKVTLRK
ncbi:purple acid phosphatase family protein [Corynebacterium tapiri]|nr:metallophosphoesterase family protein [Corynebacterium tapiri]